MKKILMCLYIILICLTATGCNKENGIKETKKYQAEDLVTLTEKTYQNIIHIVPLQETKIIENEKYEETLAFKYESPSFLKDIEDMVYSYAMKIDEPYSMTMIKVNKKAKINDIKEEIIANADMWRWFESGAEIMYVNNYGSVIIIITGRADLADRVYLELEKATENKLNEKLEKINEEDPPTEEEVIIDEETSSCPI